MHKEIELSPILFDPLKDGLHMTGRLDVKRHENRRLKLVGKRLHVFLGLLVAIGDCDLRSQRAERLSAAPGDGPVVGDSDDQSLPAFVYPRFVCRDHFQNLWLRRSTCSGDESQGMSRNHQLFVGWHDIKANAAVGRRDARLPAPIGLWVELGAKPGEPIRDALADQG